MIRSTVIPARPNFRGQGHRFDLLQKVYSVRVGRSRGATARFRRLLSCTARSPGEVFLNCYLPIFPVSKKISAMWLLRVGPQSRKVPLLSARHYAAAFVRLVMSAAVSVPDAFLMQGTNGHRQTARRWNIVAAERIRRSIAFYVRTGLISNSSQWTSGRETGDGRKMVFQIAIQLSMEAYRAFFTNASANIQLRDPIDQPMPHSN
ncbi:hypothetical protein KC361_g279 [Hortaea werneckii]|nr:hypothetical protein KC361_g279 [Hortaea werneckii]